VIPRLVASMLANYGQFAKAAQLRQLVKLPKAWPAKMRMVGGG